MPFVPTAARETASLSRSRKLVQIACLIVVGLTSFWTDLARAQFRLQEAAQISDSSGSEDQEILDLALLSDGSRVAVGETRGSVDFDPSEAELVIDTTVFSPFIAIFPHTGVQVVRVFSPISGTARATRLAIDEMDNIFVVGTFSGELEIGDGKPNLVGSSAALNGDHFLVRLQADGSVDWGIAFVAPRNFEIGAVSAALDRVVVTGVLQGTVDFDPSANTANLSSTGAEIFAASYQSSGDLEWAIKATGGEASRNDVTAAVLDNNGQVTIGGGFGGLVDFDPDPAEELLDGSTQSAFLARYDAGGSLVWARIPSTSQGTSRSKLTALTLINDNILIGGELNGSTDLDHRPTVDWVLSSTTNPGQGDDFVAEYDAQGIPLWANLIDGSGRTELGSVRLGPGELRLVGGYTFNSNVGALAFSPQASGLVSAIRSATFVTAYDATGTVTDITVLDSNSSNFGPRLTGLQVGSGGQIELAGHSVRSFDADPGPGEVIIDPVDTDGFLLTFGTDIFADGFESQPSADLGSSL